MYNGFCILLLTLCALAGCAMSPSQSAPGTERAQVQAAKPGKVIVIPEGFDVAYDSYHYAPAVRMGDTIYVSGIPAYGEGSYEDKVRVMFERLKHVLTLAGAGLADVVEITTYHQQARDSEAFREEFRRFLQVHREYFPNGYPAWTAVGGASLLVGDAPVEMRAIAVVGAGRNARMVRESEQKR